MHSPLGMSAEFRVPPLIKRNTALFALSQTFTGAGSQFAYGLGPLMVTALTGSAALAGLSVGLIGLSRFLVAYPVGKITDTFGRKPGILLGLVLALAGAVILGFSMRWRSPAMFVGGMLVFGMGMNAAQQLRVAATDMFPPHLRAQALGYIAMGSLLGLVVSPLVVTSSETLAHRIGQDPLGLAWFMIPVLIVFGMVIITFVHPDPKEIGLNLGRYYPGYTPPPRPPRTHDAKFSTRSLLGNVSTRLAIVSNCAAQGNMSIVMVLTSLVLAHRGHSLGVIAFSHMFHSIGMFAFTIPLGKLADRIGRRTVMIPGVATTLVGAGLVSFTPTYITITLGTFLVGLGWAAANVAATALIADHAETAERGRAIGVNDSFGGAVSVFAAVVTGPLIAWQGLPAAGIMAILIAIAPLAMLPAIRAERRLAHLEASALAAEARQPS
jgi:MFS family permease